MKMTISRESMILAGIGIADLVTTLVWVHSHGASEGNPVFAHYLAMGPLWFAVMKLTLLALPIFVLEWARRQRPRFTLAASRFAILAYVAVYAVGVARLNPQLLRPHHVEAAVVRLDNAVSAMVAVHAVNELQGHVAETHVHRLEVSSSQ